MGAIDERVRHELLTWDGVTPEPHRFGGVAFRLGRRELGHLHGDRFADIPFPRRIRDELIEDGLARPHHVLPDSGWVTVPIAGEDDVPRVIALFRRNYDRAVAKAGARTTARTG
jgi:hypothetical protein